MSDFLYARSQMGMSLAFQIVFAAVGTSLHVMMAISEALYLRTDRPVSWNWPKDGICRCARSYLDRPKPTVTIEISSAVQARKTGQLRRQSTSPFQNKYLMPLEIALLATSIVTSFLMPLVKQGAEKISEAVSSKFSAAAGEHVSKIAKNIWEEVKAAFSSDEEKTTLTQFEKYPEETKPLVERILKEKMEADPKLATELDKLAKSPAPGDGGTAISIAASTVGYVDARHATISGGVVAGIMQGTSSPPPSPPPTK